MKCKECGANITEYRIVGICMSYDQADKEDFFDKGMDSFVLRMSTGFKAIKMIECSECGNIQFYSLRSKQTEGMTQIPNEDDIEALTDAIRS